MNESQWIRSDLIVMSSAFREPPSTAYATFTAFLAIYLVTLGGNSLLCLAIVTDSRLHKPIYLLMAVLAVTDLIQSSNSLPRIMHDTVSPHNTTSLFECYTQMCFLHLSARLQCYTLIVMGIDRYLAVCQPLRYSSLATNALALRVIVGATVILTLLVGGNVALVARLTLCPVKVIRTPICDFLTMSNLACGGDMAAVVAYALLMTSLTVLLPLCIVLITYGLILAEVWRRRPQLTGGGQNKALRTSMTHLLVIGIYFSSVLFTIAIGLKMFAWLSVETRYLLQTVQYTVPPALNPIVYGLRMKEIGRSLRNRCRRRRVSA